MLVAVLFLFVFPTRSFLSQRRQLGRTQHDLTVLQQQNQRLADEAARLKTDSEIERIARQEYDMVRPGDQAFAVIPAPAGGDATATTTAPPSTTTTTTAAPSASSPSSPAP